MATHSLVRRVEAAEAESLRAILATCPGKPMVAPMGHGYALFHAPGSPLNKVVGVGFESIDEFDVDAIERVYARHAATVQFELSTHANPALTNVLARRGYQLSAYEDVLGCALSDVQLADSELEVHRAGAEENAAWLEVMVSGFSQPDGSAPMASHHDFERAMLERVFRDMAAGGALERWLAVRDQELAGAAGMRIQDGVAQLFGATTLPRGRRQGVHRALLAARLRDARERGCELAVVTTQPGSKSQQNAERSGFTLLYSRAVWIHTPAPSAP